MIKKCMGCGVIMQDQDKEGLGYTPNLKNEYCMRCFRLKNYGEKKLNEEVIESKIINKVNKSKGLVFFLIDYLNLNKYTLDIFKKIKRTKILVISKCDTLRKDMKFKKISNWLNKVYDINEEVLYLSNKFNNLSINIFNIMNKYNYKTCFIMGITNAGKSTFINNLLKKNNIKKEIVVSNKPNTTLDFIKLNIDNYIIYDTPGFNYNSLNDKIINKEIKPISLQIKGNVTIIINDIIKIYFKEENNIIIYGVINKVLKKYEKDKECLNKINVLDNEDLVLPGIGFINIKKEALIEINQNDLEVRASISRY